MASPEFEAHKGSWTKENPPPRRQPRKERYAGYIARAEDLLANNLESAAMAAVAIVRGEAVEHLINHKTGVVHEVPVNPATRLKAAQFIVERIAGKPDSTKTHELGEGAAGVFKVLLGASAEGHWQALAAPEVPAIEAGFVAQIPEVQRESE